ncbi:MAG: hypothetical protein IPM58_09135 [Nitrospira sp.]|nr:hypothetical protein [Nitrospira sp.]
MQPRVPQSLLSWRAQEFGHLRLSQAQSSAQPSLASSLCHPAKVLRRQMVVGELFKYVKEIRSLDNGYAFRFNRSDNLDDLLGKMAQYILLESLKSSRQIFTIDEEPKTKGFWLQVRGIEGYVPDVALVLFRSHSDGLCEATF